MSQGDEDVRVSTMTRMMRLAVAAAVALATATLLPSAARADSAEPLRSGTIVGGTGVELAGGQPWENSAAERSGCEYAAECLAWLQGGCNPALAGVEPMLTASIVDVRDLSDGRTGRTLDMAAPSIPPWGLYPGVVVQFWQRDCTEIADTRRHSIGSASTCAYPRGVTRGGRCTFHIPSGARWMTLSGYATTVNLSWTLT